MSSALATMMKPVGPKAEAFVFDKRLITGIMGPVGSAKTTSCIRKMIMGALWQKPGPDGIYRAKWGVIRDTYPQLKKTALASWWTWFPKKLGDWNGDAPYEHTVRFKVVEGARAKTVELTVIFAAIGENKVEDVMRGWEITGLWMNEGDLVAHAVFSYGMTRIGRFPSMMQGGCHWRGLILDMNAPDVDNWTYGVFVDKDLGLSDLTDEDGRSLEDVLKEELGDRYGIGFYVQPGGRSKDPPPENLHNLPAGYYAQQIMALAKTPHLIRRMVDNEFGAVRKGQPVYPEYQDELHCAKEKLQPIRGKDIRLAVDAGLTPAAVFKQRDHRGQVRTLGEVVVFADDEDTALEQLGPTAFAGQVARYAQDEFPDNRLGEIGYCDPAATAGEGAKGNEERSWRKEFQAALEEKLGYKVRIKPAPVPGNALGPRLAATRKLMLTLVEGGEPAKLICPVRCKILRRGFKGMYVYRRTQLQGGHGRYVDEPVKNDYSHVQDADQYGDVSYEKAGSDEARGMGAGHPGELGGGRPKVKVKRDYNVHAGG